MTKKREVIKVTVTRTVKYTADFGMAWMTFYATRSGSGSSRSKTKAFKIANEKAYSAALAAAKRKGRKWQRQQLRKAYRERGI